MFRDWNHETWVDVVYIGGVKTTEFEESKSLSLLPDTANSLEVQLHVLEAIIYTHALHKYRQARRIMP